MDRINLNKTGSLPLSHPAEIAADCATVAQRSALLGLDLQLG